MHAIVPLRMEALIEALPLAAELAGEQAARTPAWSDIVELYGEAREWGEGRTDRALERIPLHVRIRFVFMLDEEGTVLRWLVDGSEEAARALGGYLHQDLERGESGGRALPGYGVVRASRLPWLRRGRRIELSWYQDEASSSR